MTGSAGGPPGEAAAPRAAGGSRVATGGGRGARGALPFGHRYGPWALVAGASEGLGAAFAEALAARGLNLVLVARRPKPLADLATRLPVATRTVTADLATAGGMDAVSAATDDLEVGLVVCNAAYSPVGPFLGLDPDAALRALDLNCRAPLLLAHNYLPAMVKRGRGGFVVVSSLAGQQGAPGLAVYAATKAFGAVFAESLWAELRGSGVDVITPVAGAVSTPGAAEAMSRPAPGTVRPDQVVAATLAELGRRPRTVPGRLMPVASAIMSRLLPRRTAIGLFARNSRDLKPTTVSGSGTRTPAG